LVVPIYTFYVKKLFPNLAVDLRRAAIKVPEDRYIGNASRFSFMVALLISAFILLVLLKQKATLLWLIPVFIVFFMLMLYVILSVPKSRIKMRRAAVESDLLYSARFFLLKLESGTPLLNALIDVSRLSTKSSKFFEEIVSDVYLGTPIEKAIDNAIDFSVSPALTKILEEIKNSLKTGTDIDKELKVTLDDITKLHVIQIQAYGKKLSPLSMFYMIMGTILPSIGAAMLVIASAFLPGVINTIDMKILSFLIFIVAVIQGFFILLFKSLKPEVMN
jgi:hypothetical protein